MSDDKPIILTGERADSFEKFFEDLKPILLAALKALPSEEELRDRIKKAVEQAIIEKAEAHKFAFEREKRKTGHSMSAIARERLGIELRRM
jgi:hypothetical protein